MYSLGTPSSLQLSQQELPDTFSTEPRRISINHFPSYPPTTTQTQLDRQPSSISRRRRRLRRSTRRSYQKSLSKRKGKIPAPSSPPSSPPPVTPYPQPPSSPTGGGGPPSPGSPSCTFSLDGFMEPSLSVVGAPAGLFSYASTTGGHPASNIGVATPTEDSFPFFSPPPYPVATSNSIRVVQRSNTPHSNNRRSLHLNINHVGLPSPLPLSSNSFHHHHLQACGTGSFSAALGTSPPSSSYPPLPLPTPRPSIFGLAPAGSIRRAYARRSSNPSSPTFSHHNCNYFSHELTHCFIIFCFYTLQDFK